MVSSASNDVIIIDSDVITADPKILNPKFGLGAVDSKLVMDDYTSAVLDTSVFDDFISECDECDLSEEVMISEPDLVKFY